MPSSVAERELPGWISGPLIALTFGALLWLERRRPLRRRTRDQARRGARNLAMAALSAATISAFERPVVMPLARWGERRRVGVLKLMRLPVWLDVALSLVLLDYTLFVWHVLTHRVPLLWRLHEVHHVDADLDLTTAVRFHALEMLVSVPWRAAQVLVIGASPLGLTTWQTTTLLAILFHHSNVELPHEVERRLCRLIVTPRMHGIHHSIVQRETDSNWSTIFTWPDYLHGTARLDVPQGAVTIGAPARFDTPDLGLLTLLVMPFTPRPRSAPGPVVDRAGRGERPLRLAP